MEHRQTISSAAVRKCEPQNQLAKVVMQHPLIDRSATATRLRFSQRGNAFMGIGLCNRERLTCGMPIDVLAMMLVAEQVASNKFVLIADCHAIENGFLEKDVNQVAQKQLELLQQVVERMGARNWTFRLGSEIAKDERHVAIKESLKLHLKEDIGEYVLREIADIEWFNKVLDVPLKIGWSFSGSEESETFFDELHKKAFGSESMEFLYTVAGRTFDPEKPRAAPYFCGDSGSRILLEPGEDVRAKIDAAGLRLSGEAFRSYMNFLKRLARTWESVFGGLPDGSVTEKLQGIIAGCFQ